MSSPVNWTRELITHARAAGAKKTLVCVAVRRLGSSNKYDEETTLTGPMEGDRLALVEASLAYLVNPCELHLELLRALVGRLPVRTKNP